MAELLAEPTNFTTLWQNFIAGYGEVAEVQFVQREELNSFYCLLYSANRDLPIHFSPVYTLFHTTVNRELIMVEGVRKLTRITPNVTHTYLMFLRLPLDG